MIITKTNIEGLLIIQPKVFEDERGYFFESYHYNKFETEGISINFLQDNQSKSCYGVIRGLHYQLAPFAQTKLVRVLSGCIYDVALDIRKNSPTFGHYFGIELSGDNKTQLFIPQGFAHGFSVLSDSAEILYKCDNYYNPESERGINYNDPNFKIHWKVKKEKAIVSTKDKVLPFFDTAEMNFIYSK